jgi:cadmium resistance protein CadD (predicted permease)
MFFINGYDIHLSKARTAESFKAYKQIYTSKVIIVVLEAVLSLITLLMSRKLLSKYKYFVYRLSYWLSLIIALVFLVLCIAFILLPKGSLI